MSKKHTKTARMTINQIKIIEQIQSQQKQINKEIIIANKKRTKLATERKNSKQFPGKNNNIIKSNTLV